MFGMFSKNKPPLSLQNQLGRQANQSAQLFYYIVEKGQVPPPDADPGSPVRGSNPEDRKQLISRISEIIENENLLLLDTESKSSALNGLTTSMYSSIPLDRITDAAILMLATLSSVDTVARIYYRDYPDYAPLFGLVNQLAKTMGPAVRVIFGDDYPNDMRKLFPHVSSLLESYKANSNF
jgi:hypothetical protein